MLRFSAIVLALAPLFAAVPASAQDRGFPYSIMKPEPGTRAASRAKAREMRRRAPVPRRDAAPQGRQRLMTTLQRRQRVIRGSSYVPSLTIPRTEPIPPVAAPAVPGPRGQAAGPPPFTFTPGVGAVPNLPPLVPGRRETYQDRAARCFHQQGAFGVPGGATTPYIGSCAN